MIDCPAHGPVDGLFCVKCLPKAAKNPPIPASARAKIDKVLGRHAKPIDRDTQLERTAIQEESAW